MATMKIVDSRTSSIRQRRRALNPYNETKEDCSFELGGNSIGACVVLLFVIGFAATSTYLSGACSKFNAAISKGTSLRAPAQATNANVGETAAAGTTPKAVTVQATPKPLPTPPPQPPKIEGLPPLCTDEQNKASLRMLTPEGCDQAAYTQSCSFTKATTRGCRDPHWMRKFFATTELKSQFNAFFVGYDPAAEHYTDTPIDLLSIGTHNPKYAPQKKKWVELAGFQATSSCGRSVEEKGDVKEARVVLVVAPEKQDVVNRYKRDLEIPDQNLEIVTNPPKIDDAFFLASKLPSADSPIHYLRYVNLDRARYNAMQQMTRLSSVWYLEFTLDWKTQMNNNEQKELLNQFLPGKGFVCYWAGNDENLWRITNCWQNHYSKPTWSNVACVNAQIKEAKPLLDEMEKMFVQTLTKTDLVF